MSSDYSLSLGEALRQRSGNPRDRWEQVAPQLGGDVWPEVSPSFHIEPDDSVFTIGSCFARNIERHLEAVGCRVPVLGFRLPHEEFNGPPTGPMNKFHPPSFRQCLEWTARVYDRDGKVTWADCEAMAFDMGEGRLLDLDMALVAAVPRERFVERRQQIYDIFATAFSADCMVMTPGLIEAWKDMQTGLYIHGAPAQKAMLSLKDRWRFELLSYETCLSDLLTAIDVVRARNPEVKILVTTSPVPLTATFSGKDILIANTYSKAVLRAVCGAAVMQRPLVDYFPSYESATLSWPDRVWKEDRIHVDNGFVGRIVQHLLSRYMPGADQGALHRQNALTLLQAKDLEAASAAAGRALEIDPEDLEARAILARSLFSRAEWAQAETEARGVLAHHPDRPDLMILLGRTIGRSDPSRMGEALALIETAAASPACALDDMKKAARFVCGYAPPRPAEATLRRLVELKPRHVVVYWWLAQLYLRTGRKAAAIEALRTAAALPKSGPDLWFELAGLLAEAGKVKEASKQLRRVMNRDPLWPGAAELADRLRERLADRLQKPETVPPEGPSGGQAP